MCLCKGALELGEEGTSRFLCVGEMGVGRVDSLVLHYVIVLGYYIFLMCSFCMVWLLLIDCNVFSMFAAAVQNFSPCNSKYALQDIAQCLWHH